MSPTLCPKCVHAYHNGKKCGEKDCKCSYDIGRSGNIYMAGDESINNGGTQVGDGYYQGDRK
jgi:hypothetical protein